MTTKNRSHDISSDIERQEQDLAGEHRVRRQKVTDLRALGIEPWAELRQPSVTCREALELYREDDEPVASIAGRLVSFRLHGKTAFGHVQDWSGKIQIYIRQDAVGDALFSQLNDFYDVGDIVWAKGVIFKTKTGEVSLKADEIHLLSKSLHPLPEKFHGLADVETRYRQRYLDLISSQESREKFRKRSLLVKTMRAYLEEHDFLEVETPMLHPIPGGAAARPFVTHHNAFDAELFLRIAPELYLKRLVIGGFERVYEINRCFRNEGVSTRHNPEFTTIEAYIAYHDYHWAMSFVENMLKRIVAALCSTTVVNFGSHVLDFTGPFVRMTMYDAVKQYGKFADADLQESAIDAQLARHNVTLEKGAPWGKKLCALFEELVEPNLIQPTFIIDFPVEVSPLSRRKEGDPRLAARFELFMAGMEICNGFNELNDPFDQADRFRQQVAEHEAGDDEAHRFDADFIQALEYGLPPTVGFGIGIDRLVMLLTDTVSIKDVILFPTLKRKVTVE